MRKKRLVVILLCTFILLPCLWWLSGEPLYSYLSIQQPLANADLLIAEGWLGRDELKSVAKIYNQGNYSWLITTGVPLEREYIMGMNGWLDFHFNPILVMKEPVNLSINVRGTLSETEASKFNVYINNQKLGCDSVSYIPKTFAYKVSRIDTISFISIQFINDAFIDGQDRNLIVTSIVVNNSLYTVNDTNVIYRVPFRNDSIIYRSADSRATEASYVLQGFGISKAKIKAICTKNIKYSKTLSTARNTMQKIDSVFGPDNNLRINLISVPPHSRRTYISYKKIAPHYDIGIISINNQTEINKKNYRLRNLRELYGIILLKLLPL